MAKNKISGQDPIYRPDAMSANIKGPVTVRATISDAGDVKDVCAVNGAAELQRAAVDEVKIWKYKPYSLFGKPVEVITQVNVNFKRQ